jgi:hypothetical protein
MADRRFERRSTQLHDTMLFIFEDVHVFTQELIGVIHIKKYDILLSSLVIAGLK